jgi:hypothetical protein
METLDREIEMSGETRLDRRRRELEAQVHGHGTILTSESPTSSPSSLTRSRRRAVRPSERLLRHRERLSLVHESMDETTTTIGRPPPQIEVSEVANQEYREEAQVNRENRWRAKRRKLDDGTFEEEAKTFCYGYRGQVVPGPLKMEIVSCDGGEYSEANVGSSLPQHVLQDDSTVYCTKSNRCNMLLKHVGGMPISLTKIIIKAPGTGYDAPIQEGMIFVAMNEDRLLERTEQYEIRYSPRSYRYHHRRPDHQDLRFRPSREYLNSARSPLRSIDRSSYLRDPYPPREPDDTDRLLETALIPGFNVTTSFDDSSDTESNSRREHWSAYAPTFPNVDFDPSRLLRTYIDDHYRPTYDRMAFSDGTASSSESEHYDSNSDNHDTRAPRSPPHVDPPPRRLTLEEHDRLLARTTASSLSRPISRHGVPPSNNTELEAALTRQRHLLDRMRMQQARDSGDGGEWDRWTREYFRMEMEHGNNRRSTPSRIEIRDAAAPTPGGVSLLEGQGEAVPGDGGGSSERAVVEEPDTTTTTNAGPASIPAPNFSTPTTVKPTNMTHSTSPSSHVPLAPHARFFIRRDKSAVSIRFDPPV